MPTALELKLQASKQKTYTGKKAYKDIRTCQQLKDQAELLMQKEVEAKKARKSVLERLTVSSYLTQGYPLINQEAYSKAVKALQDKIQSHDSDIDADWLAMFGPDVDIEADRKILQLLTDPTSIEGFVPEDTQKRMATPSSLTQKDKFYISNSKFKLKTLFMQFERMKVAQAQLVSLSTDIALEFNGKLSAPPGAFQGLKSFHGALDKITNRERVSDFGDLKDVARMTVEFDTEAEMDMARNKLEGSAEFAKVKGYAKSLKNRYGTSSEGSKDDVHNSKALKSGYQDIKFFLALSNGIIGELQLNTKGMLIAKGKEHLIYDLTRAAPKGTPPKAGFTITKSAVLKPVMEKLNYSWFDFVAKRAPQTVPYLPKMKAMIKRLNDNSGERLTISAEERAAMASVSTLLYQQIGKGVGIKKSTAKPSPSTSVYQQVIDTYFS